MNRLNKSPILDLYIAASVVKMIFTPLRKASVEIHLTCCFVSLLDGANACDTIGINAISSDAKIILSGKV